jgi:hypothetical protein
MLNDEQCPLTHPKKPGKQKTGAMKSLQMYETILGSRWEKRFSGSLQCSAMKSAKESTNEIKALLESSAVSDELKQTLRLFLETPIEQAVEDARKLEEVFGRRWEAFSEPCIDLFECPAGRS